jgi:hypothetical protein
MKNKSLPVVKFGPPNFTVKKWKTKAFQLLHSVPLILQWKNEKQKPSRCDTLKGCLLSTKGREDNKKQTNGLLFSWGCVTTLSLACSSRAVRWVCAVYCESLRWESDDQWGCCCTGIHRYVRTSPVRGDVWQLMTTASGCELRTADDGSCVIDTHQTQGGEWLGLVR